MISFYCGLSLQHCWEISRQGQDGWWQTRAPGRGIAAGTATLLSGDTAAPQRVPTSALGHKWRCGHLPGETEGAALFPKGSREQDGCPTTRERKINLKKRWVETLNIALCLTWILRASQHPRLILTRSIISLGARHLGNGNNCKQQKLWIILSSLKCPFCYLMVELSHVQ